MLWTKKCPFLPPYIGIKKRATPSATELAATGIFTCFGSCQNFGESSIGFLWYKKLLGSVLCKI